MADAIILVMYMDALILQCIPWFRLSHDYNIRTGKETPGDFFSYKKEKEIWEGCCILHLGLTCTWRDFEWKNEKMNRTKFWHSLSLSYRFFFFFHLSEWHQESKLIGDFAWLRLDYSRCQRGSPPQILWIKNMQKEIKFTPSNCIRMNSYQSMKLTMELGVICNPGILES